MIPPVTLTMTDLFVLPSNGAAIAVMASRGDSVSAAAC